MQFSKIVFRIAGMYGFLVLTPMYFLADKIGRDAPPPITHLENFYGFVGIALAFQAVFLIIASDPARYRAMILPSILEKIAFGVPCLILYSQGRLATSTLAISFVDWTFAILFAVSYLKTRPTLA